MRIGKCAGAAPPLRDGLSRLKSEMDRLLNLLDTNDEAALKSWLDAAAARRQALQPPEDR